MTDITLTTRYGRAAPHWAAKVADLGYCSAYGGFVRAALPQVGVAQVCDIGTGCGTFALATLAAGVEPAGLTLVDPSPEMLDHARRELAPRTNNISCHAVTLEEFHTDQRFDLVLGAHVIEHCPDPLRALAKLYALLAPGGTLLLVISRPHWCQWLIWLRWRHRWFSEAKVRAMVRAADLPAPECHRFTAGPPQRTSFGYCFTRPLQRDITC